MAARAAKGRCQINFVVNFCSATNFSDFIQSSHWGEIGLAIERTLAIIEAGLRRQQGQYRRDSLRAFTPLDSTSWRSSPCGSPKPRRVRLLCRASQPLGHFSASSLAFMSSAARYFRMVLEAERRHFAKWRETMGATDPAKAAPGTIRRKRRSGPASKKTRLTVQTRRKPRRLRSHTSSLPASTCRIAQGEAI